MSYVQEADTSLSELAISDPSLGEGTYEQASAAAAVPIDSAHISTQPPQPSASDTSATTSAESDRLSDSMSDESASVSDGVLASDPPASDDPASLAELEAVAAEAEATAESQAVPDTAGLTDAEAGTKVDSATAAALEAVKTAAEESMDALDMTELSDDVFIDTSAGGLLQQVLETHDVHALT